MGIPIVFAALVAAATAPGPTSISIEHDQSRSPQVTKPTDVSPPMMDFEVYRVARQHSNGVACGLDFGNAPGFPKLHGRRRNLSRRRAMGARPRHSRDRARSEGLIEFSGLTYKDSKIGSPFTFIHYWCDRLDEGAGRDMLKMITSIKVARAHLN